METADALDLRQSLRVYAPTPISCETRHSILQKAIGAPTAGALMLYAILEIEDQAIKEELSVLCDRQPFIARAPWLTLFAADYFRLWNAWHNLGFAPSRKPGTGDLMLAVSDALIAAQTAVIAAQDMGIGSCYIGDIIENAERIRTLLHLPDYVFPAALLCFGYPPKGYTHLKTQRLQPDEIVHKNTYQPKDTSVLAGRVAERGFKKFNAAFSHEMTRSVEVWLAGWRSLD